MYYVGSFCKDLLKLALNYKRKGNHGGGREINALIVFRENIVKQVDHDDAREITAV